MEGLIILQLRTVYCQTFQLVTSMQNTSSITHIKCETHVPTLPMHAQVTAFAWTICKTDDTTSAALVIHTCNNEYAQTLRTVEYLYLVAQLNFS